MIIEPSIKANFQYPNKPEIKTFESSNIVKEVVDLKEHRVLKEENVALKAEVEQLKKENKEIKAELKQLQKKSRK